MRIASLAEVKAKLSAFLDEAEASGPVVITRNGRAVAVLLAPADDDDLERLLLSRSPRFQSLLATGRASMEAGEGIAHEEFWQAAADRAAQNPPEGGGRGEPRTKKKRSKAARPAR